MITADQVVGGSSQQGGSLLRHTALRTLKCEEPSFDIPGARRSADMSVDAVTWVQSNSRVSPALAR